MSQLLQVFVRGGVGGASGPSAAYVFDGVDDYATIPDWTPNGLPYEITVNGVSLTVDGTRRHMYASSNNGTRAYSNATNDRLIQQYRDTNVGNIPLDSGIVTAAGTAYEVKFLATGSGGEAVFNGTSVANTTDIPAAGSPFGAVTVIASSGIVGTQLGHG